MPLECSLTAFFVYKRVTFFTWIIVWNFVAM